MHSYFINYTVNSICAHLPIHTHTLTRHIEPTLTVNNLTTVLDSVQEDIVLSYLHDIPRSKRQQLMVSRLDFHQSIALSFSLSPCPFACVMQVWVIIAVLVWSSCLYLLENYILYTYCNLYWSPPPQLLTRPLWLSCTKNRIAIVMSGWLWGDSLPSPNTPLSPPPCLLYCKAAKLSIIKSFLLPCTPKPQQCMVYSF